jgi:DNA-directed RNA polymerase subunit RPC12/RpoP
VIVTYICSTCGSDDVSRDAAAEWSVAEQKWELKTEYDNATCERCGDETRLIEVELSPPSRTVITHSITTTEVQE